MGKNASKKIAVIMYGPPGSGKSTQAELLAKKMDLFHFDTGKYLRDLFNNSKISSQELKNLGITRKEFEEEKKKNELGKLNLPYLVLKIVSGGIKHLAKLEESIILSGSPRTIFETFGKRDDGILKLLENLYGKGNIYIFSLQIPEKDSIERNSYRSVCSICGVSLLGQWSKANGQKLSCPICGGKIEHRRDDKKEIIIGRLKEYHERTEPIFKELKNHKYDVIKINGTLEPYKIHKKILNYFLID